MCTLYRGDPLSLCVNWFDVRSLVHLLLKCACAHVVAPKGVSSIQMQNNVNSNAMMLLLQGIPKI